MASAAQAPPPALTGMAQAEFAAAKVLYQNNDFENALVKFQRAHELSGEPRLLWNIALCEKNLRRYTKMRATLVKLIESPSPLLVVSDRVDACRIIRDSQPFMGLVRFVVNVPGASVLIDGEKVGTVPLGEPVLVDLGKHNVRIHKKGFKEHARAIELPGGSDLLVKATLERESDEGKLSVTAGMTDLIELDGKVVGMGSWQGQVQAGGHTLRVSAPGMAPYQQEVNILRNETRRVPVELSTPLGPPGWLWALGGAALAGAAALGAVFLFESSPIQGNLPPGSVQVQGGGGR